MSVTGSLGDFERAEEKGGEGGEKDVRERERRSFERREEKTHFEAKYMFR